MISTYSSVSSAKNYVCDGNDLIFGCIYIHRYIDREKKEKQLKLLKKNYDNKKKYLHNQ